MGRHKLPLAHIRWQRYILILAWLCLVIGFGVARPGLYLTSANLQTIAVSNAILMITALGLLLPLVAGEYDMSVAANLTLASMLVAVLNVQEGWPVGLAILLAVALSTVIGLINGLIVVRFRVGSFIGTLGTGAILQGVVLWVSGSQTIAGVSGSLTRWTITNTLLGISTVFWYAAAGVVIIWYVLVKTAAGRRILFVGRGQQVARLSGIAVPRVRIGVFVVAGFIAGVGGFLYTGTVGSADSASGLNFLLPGFAACFLGATAIQPGRFNAIGTFCAVFFLGSGIAGLQILGAGSYVQQLFYGGALVVALILAAMVGNSSATRIVGRTQSSEAGQTHASAPSSTGAEPAFQVPDSAQGTPEGVASRGNALSEEG